jgi:hypothetical protein
MQKGVSTHSFPMVYSVSYRVSAISSVSFIHRAIRDGDFETMRELLLADPSLLTEPNSIGWTSLHVCAASPDISTETWAWVLQRVPPGLDLLMLRTDNGQNCVDHFFRLFLNPLEWQRHEVKEAAKDLKASILQCLTDDFHLQLLHQCVVHDDWVDTSNQHLYRIVSFWRRLHALLQHLSSSVVHALARTACPREVALLAMKLYPGEVMERDSLGNLPLHVACRYEGAETVMHCLLNQASILDAHGRLPLHIALLSGKTWHHGIANLWNACPQYGGTRDLITGLPAFLLAALPDPAVVQRATKRLAADMCGSLWRFMPTASQKRAMEDAKANVDLLHLSTVFEVLRAAPNVLACCCL